MLTILSPAKKLDATPVPHPATEPRFPEHTETLVRAARALSVADLRALMSISEPLARLNRDRFRDWEAAPRKPAMLAFAGDTYVGLDAATLPEDALRRAGSHLRILSGLYGLLRPFDAIRPYRLEMSSRLATTRGRNLYAFWGDRIARALSDDAEAAQSTWLLNCASREYFGAVDRAALVPRVVTPVFLEDRPGGPRTIGFAAKRARGAMARFVIETRIEDPADLRAFDAGGYVWQADRSTPDVPVFLRAHPEARAA